MNKINPDVLEIATGLEQKLMTPSFNNDIDSAVAQKGLNLKFKLEEDMFKI